MPTLEDLINAGLGFVDRNSTALGVAGQLANQEKAIRDLESLGEDAKTFIGMPAGGLYNTVKSDTQFKPFNVFSSAGNIAANATGGTTYNLSPEQQALEKSLRSGGSQLVDAVLGRGDFGTYNPETGQMEQDMRSEQAALIDLFAGPLRQENLMAGEQSAYDRLQALRRPSQDRARLQLDQEEFAQGRQGLQTAQYGGSPQRFALEKAIEEQNAADALNAMGIARQDAGALSNARLTALQQQLAEKGLGADIATQFLGASYAPENALLNAAQPSLTLSNIASTAGRQLGQYGTSLGQSQMAYDLGAQSAATNLRQGTMKGLFDLLIAQNNADATKQAAAQAATINQNPNTGQFEFGGALGNIFNTDRSANGLLNQIGNRG